MRFALLMVIACSMLGRIDTAHAQVWPEADDWYVLTCGGFPSFDPRRDGPYAVGERDVVGDRDAPALYFGVDEDHFFVRMRVDAVPFEAPTENMMFLPSGWGVEFDTDNERTSYETISIVDGVAENVVLGRNTIQQVIDDPADPFEQVLVSHPATTHARAVLADGAFASSFGGDADWFIDWALPRAELANAGVLSTTELSLVFGTSRTTRALDADLACHVSGSGRFYWKRASTDRFRIDRVAIIDRDGDGLSDAEEERIGSNADSADSDGDGYDDDDEIRGGSNPRDPQSVPDGGGLGLRGGPGGCSVGANVGASWLTAIALMLLATARRRGRRMLTRL